MRQRGFTLFELLVAAAITLVLAGLLLGTTINVLQAWRKSQGDATVTSAASLVLAQLERDLQAAIFRSNNIIWLDGRMVESGELATHGWDLTAEGILKPENESVRLMPEPRDGAPSRISDARFGRSGLWVRFFTTEGAGSQSSAPVAVGYQVVRRNFGSTEAPAYRYGLYRTRMNFEDTFNFALSTGMTDSAPAGLLRPGLGDLIATNAVDFGLWLSNRTADGEEQPVYPGSSPGEGVSAHLSQGVFWVMVRILTEEGASLVEAIERGRVVPPADRSPDAWWWEQVEAHSRVVVRRIEMKGGHQ